MKRKDAFDSDLFQREELAIAHGALTNSKRAECFVKGIYPTHLASGQGCHVYDTHGNRYIDFICALGANLFGYGQEEISGAIRVQLTKGITFSLATELEVKVAERIKELFPFAQKVRFLKTGSEACTAASIIARSFTHRKLIVTEGYHGWHPEFVSLTEPAHGVNPSPFIMKSDSTGQFANEIAAYIIEPIVTDVSEKRIEYLRWLRASTQANGQLLIFDEIITGFRYPKFSAANFYGVEPDIICLGKACAGGLPLSIIAGREDVMESDYFVSSTFAGETLSLSACLKSIELFQNKYSMQLLWDKGTQFKDQFNLFCAPDIKLEGYPTRSVFVAEEKTKALFFQEACKAGILLGPSLFFIFPHIDIMDEVLSIFSDIITRIRTGSVELQGEMPQTPFAARVRGNE